MGKDGAGHSKEIATMYELLIVAGIFGFWLLLQLVILPRLGYST